jgi:3-oxoacyl-[acyl-carrier-protein] synthase-3
MTQRRSLVAGVGSYLPERVLTNAELSTMVETSDEWIRERTGIVERRIAAEGQTTADLALKAAEAALADAGMAAADLDLIILATTTPDFTFPATATEVQVRLGMTGGAAFDLQAVCSGFVYALATADNFLARGQAQNALVIGAETMSRIVDWQDRGTCVLFGDGAGAVVLKAAPESETNAGVLQTYLRSDGQFRSLLQTDGGVSSTGTVGKLRMQGHQVFRHAVNKIAEAIETVIERAGVTAADIDWFVPHQANKRILDSVADKLGIAHERVIVTVAEHGNTSAASVPLALDAAVKDGRIKRGDLVLMEALGGGFTWGAALVRM